jgi:Uma2 family endonuclease
MLAPDGVLVRHRVPGFSERWVIVEGKVPESALHDRSVELFMQLLIAFIVRTGRDAHAYRNLAVRVDPERRQIGFDPDVCLVEPAPPEGEDLESLRLWVHPPPRFALEVVSKNHPHKDYAESPDKCAAAGVFELAIFDPLLVGPRAHGGPALLQVWRRAPDGGFERVTFGDGPAWSEALGGWLVVTDEGKRLRIADDEQAIRLWPTSEEAALRRVAELEAELARRGST